MATEVGIRELRADLSRFVKRVEAGEEIVVTDRGKPVARVVPVDRERPYDRMVREGRIRPAPEPKGDYVPKPIEGIGPMSDIVIEGRGPR